MFVKLFLTAAMFLVSQVVAWEAFQIPREDGSLISGYIDLPSHEEKLPVVVFIEGSTDESVLQNFEQLSSKIRQQKVGLIAIEKRGVIAQGLNTQEFLQHDCLEERIHDHKILLRAISQGKIKGCNGKCVLLGGSEGGKIAPVLALNFAEMVRGVVLVGAGGGFSFAEEMKYQAQQKVRRMNPFIKLGYKARHIMFPHEYEEFYEKMVKEPDSLEVYGSKTQKWWASHLRYHPLPDLLKLEMPIYMIHGKEDLMVPVRSADHVFESFKKQGKKNLMYVRPHDAGHSLKGRDDLSEPMLSWIKDRFRNEN